MYSLNLKDFGDIARVSLWHKFPRMKFVLKDFSRLGSRNAKNQDELLHNRRNILFSRFALSALVVVVAHVIQDSVQGLVVGALIDSFIGAIILITYILNERGFHIISKTVLLTFVNFSLAIYCSLIPKHNGIYLFYFPLIGLSSVVFDSKHRSRGLFFIGLSATFLIALVMTDFKLLGDMSIPASREQNSFLINLTSSLLVLMLCIHFIMKYNDESEKHLIWLAEEVRQKNFNLEKANAELDRFVYSASHDLRAPLLSIQGIVNIARLEKATVGMSNYLTLIHNQVVKLDSFIKDIVCYSRNARTETKCQSVNINEVLEEVREDLKYMKGAQQIRWEKQIETGEMTTDRCRMNTIFNNLISNAIKYHNKDIKDPWLKIGIKRNCNHYYITIRDNGLGIPTEHQGKVFDMFYRAHDHSTGSGLGLYIVKEIIAKMNGQIELTSQPGQGSTFTITLPMAAA